MDPEVFAPGLISVGAHERDMAISANGKEIYFCTTVGRISTILVTRESNGRWSEPRVVPFASGYLHLDPCLSPDGQRLLFLSNRPSSSSSSAPGSEDIWAVDRVGETWGEPYNLGPPVNTEAAEFFPSLTQDGTLYFTRQTDSGSAIYRSRLVEGTYGEPERLPEQVNSGGAQYNAFVARDESFLIVPTAGREDSLGGTDYYVVFRFEDDSWSQPINLGPKVNSATGREWSPYVSPDGKYFFFMSSRTPFDQPELPRPRDSQGLMQVHNQPQNGNSDIWWVDASIIEGLRPDTR
jgi:Tol biopolymer transport system component